MLEPSKATRNDDAVCTREVLQAAAGRTAPWTSEMATPQQHSNCLPRKMDNAEPIWSSHTVALMYGRLPSLLI